MIAQGFTIKPFENKYLDEAHALIAHTITTIYPAFYNNEVVDFFLEYHSKSSLSEKSEKGFLILGFYNDMLIATGYLVEKEIGGVYVHPEYQKKGYGKLIVKKLIEVAHAKHLDFLWLHSTPPAFEFYSKLGFVLDEELIDYVGNNSPLPYYSMKLKLKSD